MGFGIKELLVVLVIVLLLFGTKKLKNIGSDLGSAIKGFKKSMDDNPDKPPSESIEQSQAEDIGQGQAEETPGKTTEK